MNFKLETIGSRSACTQNIRRHRLNKKLQERREKRKTPTVAADLDRLRATLAAEHEARASDAGSAATAAEELRVKLTAAKQNAAAADASSRGPPPAAAGAEAAAVPPSPPLGICFFCYGVNI